MSLTRATRRQALEAAAAAAIGFALGGASTRASAQAAHDISGPLTSWDFSDAPSVFGVQTQADFYQKYIPSEFKDLKFSSTIYGYGDLLPKLTVAWRAGSQPDVARVAVAWSPQFVNAGQCAEITEEELGIPFSQFFPQALQSLRKGGASSGPLYGVPTNNETLLLLLQQILVQEGRARSRISRRRHGPISPTMPRKSTTTPAPTASACVRSRITAIRRSGSCRWRGLMAGRFSTN